MVLTYIMILIIKPHMSNVMKEGLEKAGSFEVLHVLKYIFYALYVRWKFELIVYGETDS